MIEETNIMPPTKVEARFYLRIRKCISTFNGNGYGHYQLDWAFYKSRGYKTLYHFIIGNGKTGEQTCN